MVDLAKFDPLTPELDLFVLAAEEQNCAIRKEASEISTAINPPERWMIEKFRICLFW